MRCDSCEAILCHEHGCPRAHSRYDEADGWIDQRECLDCGITIDYDDPCCSADFDQ